MTTPELHLHTCYRLNAAGRIVSTREPWGTLGPLFALVRGPVSCAWAIGADVPLSIAEQLERLARDEAPASDFREPPRHAQRYIEALGGLVSARESVIAKTRESDGPAFSFPSSLTAFEDVVPINSESLLERHFDGWVPGEIDAGRAPVFGVFENGVPVSICFCARRSGSAAEAGLATARPYWRKGFGARVTAAWARAIRKTGRVPLYSTSWTNESSLAVARKLGLVTYASSWSIAG